MAAPDPAAAERQWYVDMHLNGVDNPALSLSQLRNMGGGSVNAYRAAIANRFDEENPNIPPIPHSSTLDRGVNDAHPQYELLVDRVGWATVYAPAVDRPVAYRVLWVGGTTQPLNMEIGDLWVKDGPGSGGGGGGEPVPDANKVSINTLYYNVQDYGAVGDNATDSTTYVADAVAAAVAASSAGGDVYWPAGTYILSGNIPNFWSVDHFGPGRINRGGQIFYLDPAPNQINSLFMNADTGSPTYDGLTADRPVDSFSRVDYILQRMSPRMLRGSVMVNMAGTFTGGWTFAHMPRTTSPIVFQGEALVGGKPVTTINFDGTDKIFGMRFEPGAWVQLLNLKFTNFSIGFNGYGALVKGGGDMYVKDCQAINCDCGFAAVDQAVMGVYSSEADDCITGVKVIYGSTGTIGANGLPSLVHNCDVGILVSRNAVAHVDYTEVSANTIYGIHVDMQSRMAMVQGAVLRNPVGVRIEGGAEWTKDPATNFGVGSGVDINGTNWNHHGAGHENRLHAQRSQVEWRWHATSTSYGTSVGTNTMLYALGSSFYFPAGHFDIQADKRIRVKILGEFIGTASKSLAFYKTNTDSTVQIPLGSVSGITAAGNFVAEINIWPTTSGSQEFISTCSVEGQPLKITRGTSAASTDVDWLFRLYANSGTPASTVNVWFAEVFITG